MENEKNEREHVEAVPGPAIIISKEAYRKMQENDNSEQNKKRLKKYEEFFKRIHNVTETPKEEELIK